jgi:hypothetical protein
MTHQPGYETSYVCWSETHDFPYFGATRVPQTNRIDGWALLATTIVNPIHLGKTMTNMHDLFKYQRHVKFGSINVYNQYTIPIVRYCFSTERCGSQIIDAEKWEP